MDATTAIELFSQPAVLLLVLLRLLPVFLLLPAFGGRYAGRMPRLAIALVLLAGLLPVLADQPKLPEGGAVLVALAVKELVIGVAIAVFASLVFHAAEVLGSSLGLFVELTEENSTLALAKGLFFVCIFFATEGHHLLLRGLVDSYSVFPLLYRPTDIWYVEMLGRLAGFFVLVVLLTAPVLVGVVLLAGTEILVARTIATPQQPVLGRAVLSMLLLVGFLLALPALANLAADEMHELLRLVFAKS